MIKNGVYIGTYPIKIVALGGIVGFVVITNAFKMIKGKITRKELFCKIEIRIGNKKTNVTAMVDTGNLLREPITKAPVMIVEKQSLFEILPRELLDNTTGILQGRELPILKEYGAKLRVIPFSSLGKQNGMLLGIRTDEIIIFTEEEEIQVPNVIVGISNEALTKNGLYTSLIGLEILERSQSDEPVKLT